MEPFGLFNLLRQLPFFPFSGEKSPQNAPPVSDAENAANLRRDSSPAPPASSPLKDAPSAAVSPADGSEYVPDSCDQILAFLERHERMSGDISRRPKK